MIDRLFTQCMLRPSDLKPQHDGMKIIGTFNPGVVETPTGIVLLARICEAPIEQRAGHHASPRIDSQGDLAIDYLADVDYDTSDPRTLTRLRDKCMRLRFISYLRMFRSSDGKTIDDLDGPVIAPQGEYEIYGIEDPRITRISDTYYITYVAVSPHGVSTALISTTDFKTFKRHGIIFCPENKDVVLFPRKVLGQYMAMHRPVPAMRFVSPQIWLARSTDMIHWGAHTPLDITNQSWQNDRIGGGTPPIDTREGFLTIYHGSQNTNSKSGVGIYTAGALLLDRDNPAHVISHTTEPIMQPEADFERCGFVDNVIFPTAIIERDDELWVYYGAADERVGVTALRRADVLNALH